LRKRKKPVTKIPKFILLIFKLLSKISSRLTTLLAVKLFSTPIKYKTPKREHEYYNNSNKYFLNIPELNKKIRIFEYGNFDKKVLLVHGWSGRGTQLNIIAEKFNSLGYTCISFDAPAHGKSDGKTTLMVEFVACIMELEKQHQFEYAVGHSLGGMSVLRAMSQGLKVKKAVVIGIGDLIEDIIIDFVTKLKLDLKFVNLINQSFEQKFGLKMNDFASSVSVQKIEQPIMIIHDENDLDVPVSCAYSIEKNSKNVKLLITKKLGHRKILSDEKVIKEMIDFLEN
jgi:pimeloyl-ACP methyl ester carboxylesterase